MSRLIDELRRHLTRPEVDELVLVSNRSPTITIGGRAQAASDATPSADEILQMLMAIGGSRYVETLEEKPAQWTARVDGIGAVSVIAAMDGQQVNVRFAMPKKDGAAAAKPAGRTAAAPQSSRGPAIARMDDELVLDRSSGAGGRQVQARAERAQEVATPPMREVAPASREVTPAPVGNPKEAAPQREASRRSVRVDSEQPTPMPTASSSLDALLYRAAELRASDIHIVADRPLLLRIATELVPEGNPLPASTVAALAEQVVPPRLRENLERDGACDFALDHPTAGRFRINVSRQRTGYKLSMRVIPREMPTLTSLGLPPSIASATNHHQGLVLITGPTGHGKTSTLAALVDLINDRGPEHILTIEDPVEYVHRGKKAMMSQREVGSDTRSFAAALKASLREDPDVMVIGELRDANTVRMAVSASETGHLVLGTMNTPSAAKTIDRLIDLFPPAEQSQVRTSVAGALRMIVGQRLVPSADRSRLHAAVELLPTSIALYAMIRDGKTFQIPSLQQRGRAMGVIRLDESLVELVRAKKITAEVAKMFAEVPNELEAALARAAGAPAAAPPGQAPGKRM